MLHTQENNMMESHSTCKLFIVHGERERGRTGKRPSEEISESEWEREGEGGRGREGETERDQ